MAAGAQAATRPIASVPNPPATEAEAVSVAAMSPSLSHFAPAFVRVQQQLKPVVKNNNNPHFDSDFADLAAILEEALPILNDNGFALMQFPSTDGLGRLALMSMLVHESGQFVSSTMPLLLAKNDPQGEGSAITYGRRYGACAILGIRTVDDDGNAGSSRSERPQRQARQPQRGRQPGPPADDAPPHEDAAAPPGPPPLPEGWPEWAACDAAHAAVRDQILAFKKSAPEDDPAHAAVKEHKDKYGWPMANEALAELARIVARAQKPSPPAPPESAPAEPAQRPSGAQNAPAAPNPRPEPPAPTQRPQGGPVGEGVRVLPDGSRIVPKTLCIWCEKPLADGRPVTPPIASESDPADKRAWHVECLDAWEASLEGDGPAEEGS